METDILDVRLMVAVDRYSITSMLRRLLRRQFDTIPLTKDDFMGLKDEVDVLNCRMNSRIDQLHRISEQQRDSASASVASGEVRFGYLYEEGFYECAFVVWAQLLLMLMVHKIYCVLYQPLVRDLNHSMWDQIRTEQVLDSLPNHYANDYPAASITAKNSCRNSSKCAPQTHSVPIIGSTPDSTSPCTRPSFYYLTCSEHRNHLRPGSPWLSLIRCSPSFHKMMG